MFLRHEKALEAITICGEIEGRERFIPIIQGLETRNETLRVSYRSLIFSHSDLLSNFDVFWYLSLYYILRQVYLC